MFVILSELKSVLPGRGWVQQKPLYAWTAWRWRTSGRMRTSPGISVCEWVRVRESLRLCTQFVQFAHRLWQAGSSDDGKPVTCVECWRAAGVFIPRCGRSVLHEQNSRQHRATKKEKSNTSQCPEIKKYSAAYTLYCQESFLQRRRCVVKNEQRKQIIHQVYSHIYTHCVAQCCLLFDISLLKVIFVFINYNIRIV